MPPSLTPGQFEQMFPGAGEHYPHFLAAGGACDAFGITNLERQAAFFAEVGYESNGLLRLDESFAYTPARLMTVFPFRFTTMEKATDYVARGPKAIANLVYAMRLGNGPEKSGDGWRFRGRGFVQLTGRNNYAEFAGALSLPLVMNPDLAAEPANAARIAARFWKTRGCNEMADLRNMVGITQAINGGLTGLKERMATWRRLRSILGLTLETIA